MLELPLILVLRIIVRASPLFLREWFFNTARSKLGTTKRDLTLLVRLSINTPKENVLRHISKNSFQSLGIDLVINEHVERPDYWFVYSKGADKEERSIIPRSMLSSLLVSLSISTAIVRSFLWNLACLWALAMTYRNTVEYLNEVILRKRGWLVGILK